MSPSPGLPVDPTLEFLHRRKEALERKLRSDPADSFSKFVGGGLSDELDELAMLRREIRRIEQAYYPNSAALRR